MSSSPVCDQILGDTAESDSTWELDQEVIWDEPTPSRPNGRYRARFEATRAEAEAITRAVDDALDRGEGLLYHVFYYETEFLLRWRLATHPKKARAGAQRGRPRSKRLAAWQANPGLQGLLRATLYRRWRAAMERRRHRHPAGSDHA
jgi:hypothetical protein